MPGIFKTYLLPQKLRRGECSRQCSAKGKKLKVPSKAYRTRQWERPDQFIFDKAAYQNYFPNDEYEAEADYHEWVKMPAEVLDTFNTATSSAFRIKQPLLQGWYCVEATTKIMMAWK